MSKVKFLSLICSFLAIPFGAQANEASKNSDLEKKIFPRFQSKARREFYKKEIEKLCADGKCSEDQKKFPSIQLLNDPDLFFRFEVPVWSESKGATHMGQFLSLYDLKRGLPKLDEVDVTAIKNFVNHLMLKGKEQSGRLFVIRETTFGKGIESLSLNESVLEKDYTINLLLYPAIFDGIKEDLKLKNVLLAPVLQNDLLLAEDSPEHRKQLHEAISKMRKLNDEKFWASQKVYRYNGRDFDLAE